MTKVYDADWYHRRIADLETGEPRRFTGGALAVVDEVLDAYYFGVAYENERRRMDHAVRCAGNLPALLFGNAEPVTGHLSLDTTAWLGEFEILWDPQNLPPHLDPANAVNFRLDVLRAMRELPLSWRRALVHAMDGYSLAETAGLLGWTREPKDSEGWELAVVDGEGARWYSQRDSVPNTESAERVVRNASSKVRAHCSIGQPRKEPKAPKFGTEVIAEIERDIARIRDWRSRELRRKERAQQRALQEAA